MPSWFTAIKTCPRPNEFLEPAGHDCGILISSTSLPISGDTLCKHAITDHAFSNPLLIFKPDPTRFTPLFPEFNPPTTPRVPPLPFFPFNVFTCLY